jgi:uncharacterized protein YhdP
LDIAVNLNMVNAADVKVEGQYTFVNNRLMVVPNAPAVSAIHGAIQFTERTVDSQDLQGQWSGEPLAIRIATDAQGTSINASGVPVWRNCATTMACRFLSNFGKDGVAGASLDARR